MIEFMDKKTESRMLRCVEQVIDAVREDNLSPTDALVKVAQQHELTPPWIRRVAEAFNTSRSIGNQQSKVGEARCQPFALAYADLAMQRVFPDNNKTAGERYIERQMSKAAGECSAVSIPDFMDKAARDKRAEIDYPKLEVKPYEVDGVVAYRRFQKVADDHRFQVKQAESALTEAELRIDLTLKAAASDVRNSLKQLPFEQLEQGLIKQYGQDHGTKLASVLWHAVDAASFGQTRAVAPRNVLLDYSISPFSTIDRFVKAALDANQRRTAVERLKEAEPPNPFSKAASANAAQPVNSLIKSGADDGETASQSPWSMPLARKLISTATSPLNISESPMYRSALSQAIDQVDDPDIRDSSRMIKVKAMIADFMANDPVLKKAPREDVLNYFNELSQITPDIIDKPALVRGMLRRAVHYGGLDPIDAGQFVGINSQHRQNQKVDNSRLEALTADAQSLRPEWDQTGISSADALRSRFFTPMLNGGQAGQLPSVRYHDPKLRMQQEQLMQGERQLGQGDARLKQDSSQFKERQEAQADEARKQRILTRGEGRASRRTQREEGLAGRTSNETISAARESGLDSRLTQTLAQDKHLNDRALKSTWDQLNQTQRNSNKQKDLDRSQANALSQRQTLSNLVTTAWGINANNPITTSLPNANQIPGLTNAGESIFNRTPVP